MKKLLFVLLAGMLIAGCSGKKEVKQVSQESKTAVEALSVAEAVRAAFLNKDTSTIQKNSTDAGFRDITANKKVYDSVDISFTPRWVEIEGDHLLANISWKSTWTLSGRKTEERGMAVFMMQGSPLKISKIIRANPFIFPE